MFKLIILALGMVIGYLGAPFVGGCNLIDHPVLKYFNTAPADKSANVWDYLNMEAAAATSYQPPLGIVSQEEKLTNADAGEFGMGFGYLNSCEDNCQGREYGVYPRIPMLANMVRLSYRKQIDEISMVIAVSLKRDRICNGSKELNLVMGIGIEPVTSEVMSITSYAAIPAFTGWLLEEERKPSAQAWHNAIVDNLSLGLQSNLANYKGWDILHDNLLLTSTGSDKEAETIRMKHPAGDPFLLDFQRKVLLKYYEAEVLCN